MTFPSLSFEKISRLFSTLPPTPILAGLSYAFCSTALTLANKHIFSSDALDCPWTLLSIQSNIVTILLIICRLLQRKRLFSFVLLRQIAIPCILFTIYIYTNSRALRTVSLPVFSVLKSLAPMGIALMERFFFRDPITYGTSAAMCLIIIGNAITAFTDIEYSPTGYAWALFNVIINIAHVLSLRICLTDAFTPIEKTLHSNFIAACIMMPFAIYNSEIPTFVVEVQQTTVTFRIIYMMSCLLAAGIGASIFWLVQTTSGSTLSFVGACNKFSVVILGGILFRAKISPQGWVSVVFGVLAGIVFAFAKSASRHSSSSSSVDSLHLYLSDEYEDDEKEHGVLIKQ